MRIWGHGPPEEMWGLQPADSEGVKYLRKCYAIICN